MSSIVAELFEQWIEEAEELERQKRPPRYSLSGDQIYSENILIIRCDI